VVPERDSGHFNCPFCNSYDVNRLFIASADLDSCECLSCGARWDQERSSGKYLGRSDRSSVLAPRPAR
jgi:transcription elongation factor Elf1